MDRSHTPGIAGFVAAVLVTLSFTGAAWAAGSVRFSYEKVEVGSEVQWVLVPRADTSLTGSGKDVITKAFNSLKKDKRSTYGGATISVSGRSASNANVSVKIDPKYVRYKLIVMAETVYTFTELGVDKVSFPGHSSKALKRENIPFASYTLTVPLWKALPNLSSEHVRVLMPNGDVRPSQGVIDDWRKKDPALLKALYDYLDSPDAYTVTTVAKLLPELRLDYVDPLIPLLKDDRSSVRKTALELLEKHRNEDKVASAVTAMMKAEKVESLAAQAADFLIEARGKDVSLEGHLYYLNKGDEKKAVEAAGKLASYKQPAATKALADELVDERKPLTEAAAAALEKLGAADAQQVALKNSKVDPALRLTIAGHLTDDRDAQVRLAGFAYIAENAPEDDAVKAVREIGAIKTDEARKTLENYLTDDKKYLRLTAAAELVDRKSVESLTAFAKAVKAKKNSELMENSGYQILTEQSQNTILETANSRNNIVQRMAYRALGELVQKGKGSSKIFDILEKGLSNRDELIRGASARAIGSFGNDKAARALQKVIKDKDADVRADVAVALGRFKGTILLDELQKYLDDSAPQVKAAAVTSLAQRKEAASWDKIKELAGSKNDAVRGSAMKALASLVSREDTAGVRNVISILSGGVSDSSPSVRIDAIQALGTFKDGKAVTGIALQLNAEEEDVRLEAIKALGETGHPSAVELLKSVLSDPGKKVRRAAIEALGELGGIARMTLEEYLKTEKDSDLEKLTKSTLKSM